MEVVPELARLPYAAALVAHDGVWEADGDYDTVHFDGGSAAEVAAPGARFIECAFTDLTLEGGRLPSTRFNEVWLREVRLVGTDLSGASMLDSAFLRGVLAGVRLPECELRRVVFRGCKLDAVSFWNAALTDVRFEDCLLREVDFRGAALTRTSFPGCRLSGTDLTGVRLDEVDLRGAELGIRLGPESLRGAVVDRGQLMDLAPLLADALGIRVE